jgi:hypothetical protein
VAAAASVQAAGGFPSLANASDLQDTAFYRVFCEAFLQNTAFHRVFCGAFLQNTAFHTLLKALFS